MFTRRSSRQMNRPFSSQLITRRCIAASTADVLLMDQPRKRSWFSEMVWCFLLIGVASSPTSLGAAGRTLDQAPAFATQPGDLQGNQSAVLSGETPAPVGDVPASDQSAPSSDGACIVEAK